MAQRQAVRPKSNEPELVSVIEAARRLGISEEAVRLRIHQGTLPAQKVGGRWIVELRPKVNPLRWLRWPTDMEILGLFIAIFGSAQILWFNLSWTIGAIISSFGLFIAYGIAQPRHHDDHADTPPKTPGWKGVSLNLHITAALIVFVCLALGARLR
jgi:excisionase family DNA binding protein